MFEVKDDLFSHPLQGVDSTHIWGNVLTHISLIAELSQNWDGPKRERLLHMDSFSTWPGIMICWEGALALRDRLPRFISLPLFSWSQLKLLSKR